MTNVAETYTISNFIEAGKNMDISYNNFSILEKVGNIEYPVYNVANFYIDELKEVAVDVRLSDSEFTKYQFEPKLLAYDLYGETELYFVLMIINNIYDIRDFNMKKIKVIRPQDIAIINRIFSAEKGYIESNRIKIKGE